MTTTAVTTAYCDGSSLANFNAWAQWIYDQFIAFGWTQTADTGQGVIPAVGSVPSAAGYYVIFQSADALSSTCPITVKLEFFAASSVPSFGLTVGTGGTNGAGILLFPVSKYMYGGGTYSLKASSSSTTNLLPLYASGDAGNIRFGLWVNSNTLSADTYNLVYIIISRSRDATGAQTGSYVQFWCGCGTSKFFQTIFAPPLGPTNIFDNSGSVIAAVPSSSTSWTQNGNTMAVPIMQNIGGLSNPTPDLLLVSFTDFTAGNIVVVTVYGVAHTYVVVVTNGVNNFNLQATNCALLMRYE